MLYVRANLALVVWMLSSPLAMALIGDAVRPQSKKWIQPFRLVSNEKHQQLQSQLPPVDDPRLEELFNDPSLLFYTEAEVPPAYQDWSSGLKGIHAPSYNVSANRSEPYGNGNVEFPWGSPGGTHRTTNVTTFRFVWLPRDERGRPRPIVWYRKFLPGSTSEGYAWIFPVGTVVGEVLQMRAPWGKLYTFELRVRTRESGAWAVDVFRPFRSTDELVSRIKELRPNWQNDTRLVKFIKSIQAPIRLTRHTLSDSNHSRLVFHQSMGVHNLPPIGDDALVVQLLTETVFKSALGSTWYTDSSRLHTVAPTTDAPFHIVPARYDAGFIEVDQVSCMRCHETVNQHVNDFNFGRDWYGRVRGSDGIFSIHPFDPSCISYNGTSQPARLNPTLINAGLLAPFDPRVHSTEIYHKLRPLEP
jgi:hypothetical protein